ncbi:MAG: energy transducer TonB [Bradymonadales bacterium]|jgi:TonB family protein
MRSATPVPVRFVFVAASVAIHLIMLAAFAFSAPQNEASKTWERPCIDENMLGQNTQCESAECSPVQRKEEERKELKLRLVQQSAVFEKSDTAPNDARFAGAENIVVQKDTKASPSPVARLRARTRAEKPQSPKPAKMQKAQVAETHGSEKILAQSEEKNDEKDLNNKEISKAAPAFELSLPSSGWEAVISDLDETPIDFLDEVDDIGQGLVNQRLTRYASFWNRIRMQVSSQWDPENVYLAHDPQFDRYPMIKRHTLLSVRLNAYGQILDLQIKRSCGLDFLDEEARRAMYNAAPFANPPEGLKNLDGELQFEFGFIVEWLTGARRLYYR